MKYQVYTLSERVDLKDQLAALDNDSWPVFLQNSDAQSWTHFYESLSDYVLLLTIDDKVIAAGFTVPIEWDQTVANLPVGIEDVLQRGLIALRNTQQTNTLVPIGALVDSKVQGRGLSSIVLKEMKKLATSVGLDALVVPVRPTKKTKYPLQAIVSYAKWRQDDGYLYDPWLRVHEKLGAQIIHIAESTLTVSGNLSDWSKWTGMVFPTTGQYIVPGALAAVEVNKENNYATYHEPNVWMLHPM